MRDRHAVVAGCAAKPLVFRDGVGSGFCKTADDLGVAVGELEYMQAIGHDASWVAQLRGVG